MRHYVQHFSCLLCVAYLTLICGDQSYNPYPQRKAFEAAQYPNYNYPQTYSRYEQQQLPESYPRHQENYGSEGSQGRNTQAVTNQYTLPEQQQLQQWGSRQTIPDYGQNPYATLPTTFGNGYPRGAYSVYDRNIYNRNPQPIELNRTPPHHNERLAPAVFPADNYYRQNEIGSPSSYDSNQAPSPGSLQRPQYLTAQDYAAHFERYVRKYPYRLQPRFV